MKVNDLMETEFDNQEVTLAHLYRIQRARVHEFWQYLWQLTRQYPTFSSLLSLPALTNETTSAKLASSMAISRAKRVSLLFTQTLLLRSMKPLSQQEKDKYVAKFDRMIDAKEAYENAGGKYESK